MHFEHEPISYLQKFVYYFVCFISSKHHLILEFHLKEFLILRKLPSNLIVINLFSCTVTFDKSIPI